MKTNPPADAVRLYADNAATSFPKPPQVLEAMSRYALTLGASAGRGAYAEALATGELVADCRRRLAKLLHAERPEQIVFTLNCTEALNLAIKGRLNEGDHVVATVMEHNSILRPLGAMQARRFIQATYVAADPHTGLVDADDVLRCVRSDTRLVAVQHAGNVTGAVQPIAEIGRRLRERDIPLLIDAAQTAGHVPIDVRALHADFLAMPGHKGLMGPLGTGALYIRPGQEQALRPLIEGGTGSVSDLPMQPDFMPDRFESGSHNAIGLAGLGASLEWIENKTVEALYEHDQALCRRFIERLAGHPGIALFGPGDPARRTAVFSVRIEGLEPSELSALLESEFGILTRSGIHCAPLAHEALGTLKRGGTTRLSFGAYNTLKDVDRCASALKSLTAAGVISR